METEAQKKFQKFWREFFQSAPYESGFDFPVSTGNDQTKLEAADKERELIIKSINPDLIKKGQQFFDDNRAVLLFGIIASHVYGISMKRSVTVFLRTNEGPYDSALYAKRRLNEGFHVIHWFRSDFTLNPEKAITNLMTTRRVHQLTFKKHGHTPTDFESLGLDFSKKVTLTQEEKEAVIVAEAIRADMTQVTCPKSSIIVPDDIFSYDPKMPMSQADLALSQAAFWIVYKLFPANSGIPPHEREEGLAAYVHLWSVVTRALGLKDCYNIALHEDLNDGALYCRGVIDFILLPVVQQIEPMMILLQKWFLEQFTSGVFFTIRYKTIIYLTLTKTWSEYEGQNLKRLMTWQDLLQLKFFDWGFYLTENFKWFRITVNYITEKVSVYLFRKYLENYDKKRSVF